MVVGAAMPPPAFVAADDGPIGPLIKDVIPDSAKWLNAPNGAFGGRPPGDLIETADEPRLREFVLAYKYGVFS